VIDGHRRRRAAISTCLVPPRPCRGVTATTKPNDLTQPRFTLALSRALQGAHCRSGIERGASFTGDGRRLRAVVKAGGSPIAATDLHAPGAGSRPVDRTLLADPGDAWALAADTLASKQWTSETGTLPGPHAAPLSIEFQRSRAPRLSTIRGRRDALSLVARRGCLALLVRTAAFRGEVLAGLRFALAPGCVDACVLRFGAPARSLVSAQREAVAPGVNVKCPRRSGR
jgi:hypothetical protein